jgi:DNA mismatch repair protein MutS
MACFDSILFTHPRDDTGDLTPPECFSDLHLDQIVDAIVRGNTDGGFKNYFYAPLHDVGAVHYRHEIFTDLQSDAIRQPIASFVNDMKTVYRRLERAETIHHRLQQQRWFLDAVRGYCDALRSLRQNLSWADVSSRGLSHFAEYLAEYVDGPPFQALFAETESVQAELGKVRYTVHIEGLKVRVGIFQDQTDFSTEVAGVFDRFRGEGHDDHCRPLADSEYMNHVERMILERVAKLDSPTFEMLAQYCARNSGFIDPTIATFEREIGFYLAYLAFIARFAKSGLRFSYPTVSSSFDGVYAEDAFDLALANSRHVSTESLVCNDFRLCGAERIFVVTGPNQGGKTTFARTIGQVIYLAALGCPVPAARAAMVLPDQIFTHFERQESLATLRGKLDNELVSIHNILSRATANSVIVMNESFASTTVDDSLLIGTEVLRRIIVVGCIAVYVTFLDELASLDPACVSVVGEVAQDDPTQRTFHFTRRPADGLAYAAALADKYGLSREKLARRIHR